MKINEEFKGRNGYKFRPHGTLYVDALNTVTDAGTRLSVGLLEDLEQHFLAKYGYWKASNDLWVRRETSFEVDSDMAAIVHDENLKVVDLRWSNLPDCDCAVCTAAIEFFAAHLNPEEVN